MPRKRGPARINGPYKTGDRWTFILISDGKKTTCHAPTEEEAERLIEELKPTLQAPPERTVMQAVEEYKEHMKVKGNRPGAVKSTGFALSRFLQPDDRPLADVTAKWCARRYFGSPGRDGKPAGGLVQELASDTHRNYLAETRTFFNWCREKPRCWLNKNPLAEVKGIGKRNPGGKGKKQLRLCDSAGVPLTHAHGMRGLAGTLAALGGAEEAFERARQRLGHSHKSTTLDSYAADEAVSEVREQARLRVINGDLK